jgi:hypothetical protein
MKCINCNKKIDDINDEIYECNDCGDIFCEECEKTCLNPCFWCDELICGSCENTVTTIDYDGEELEVEVCENCYDDCNSKEDDG